MTDADSRPAGADPTLGGGLNGWLVERGLRGGDMAGLVDGYCARLVDAGVPILRLFAGVQTLHPLYDGFSYIWRREDDVPTRETYLRNRQDQNAEYLVSPFHDMLLRGLPRLRQRLDGPAEREFAIYSDFRAAGATDYYVRLVGFGSHYDNVGGGLEGDGLIVSWLTDRVGGFSDEQLALIDASYPIFALAMRAEATNETAHSIAATYLGSDPGQRVFDGAIDRGAVSRIRAVIYFADLRGFTRLSQELPAREVVHMLNDYLDCLARPVLDAGGEVLKFMGDGVLAVFDIDQHGTGAACGRALQAARAALAGIDDINRRRRRDGRPEMETDLALHLGDVMYGNVGVEGRLDFTVIGQAVNEASRIEGACHQLNRHLLASEAFFRACDGHDGSLVSLGRHRLRDIADPQELFGLPAELDAAG